MHTERRSSEPVTRYIPNVSDTTAPTSYGTKKEADEMCAILNSLRNETELGQSDPQNSGQRIAYEYHVVSKDGQYTIHYYKVFKGETQLGPAELYGKLQSEREVLTQRGVFSTVEDLKADPNAASKRGLPFYQKALDVLANTLAGVLNKANMDNGGGPLFSSDSNTDYEKPEGSDSYSEGINASNISISKSWANGSFRIIANDNEFQSTGSDNLSHMLALLTEDHQFTPGLSVYSDGTDQPYSPEVFFTGSFQELLTTHIAGSLAKDQSLAQTMLNNYEITANDLYVDRDAVMGVDLNDEAMDMMMFQKAYSAACRLMTVYDSMLEKLINGT